jgi:hypothetical protein
MTLVSDCLVPTAAARAVTVAAEEPPRALTYSTGLRQDLPAPAGHADGPQPYLACWTDAPAVFAYVSVSQLPVADGLAGVVAGGPQLVVGSQLGQEARHHCVQHLLHHLQSLEYG